MAPVLENQKVIVVLIGKFEPSMALPAKLGAAGVIRADEARAAEFKTLVKDQVVEYALEWCSVSVVRNRFAVETAVPPFVKVADLIQKTINELMTGASVTQMGINRLYEMKFSSNAERDAFGTRIVPPSTWGKWGRQVGERIKTNPESHGGVISVVMRETPVAGEDLRTRDVTIQATPRTSTSPAQAILGLNDNFNVSDANQPTGLEPQELANRHTSSLMRILGEQFDKSINDLESMAHDIIGISS
ncbi:MAG: hypothetical protein WA803_15975 [Steroidobacteraceae bacterium]